MNKFYKYVLLSAFFLICQLVTFAQQEDGHKNLDSKNLDYIHKAGLSIKSSDPSVGFLEGGYCSTLNVYQGETISFYVSTHANPFSLKIYRYGKTKEQVATIDNLPGGTKQIRLSDQVWVKGCNWTPVVKDFKIPMNWKAGAYIAEFPTNSDTVNPILFFVKEKDPAKRSRVLVAASTNTYNAYNMFGGKSIYDEFSIKLNDDDNPPRSYKITFHRPFNRNNHHGVNRGSFDAYDAKLVYWLESYGYGKDVDIIAESDLQFDPDYLNSHDVLLVCGHGEYWSRKMRENVEKFVDNGKHFMNLSGNTCWWQVRMDDPNTLVCYKHSTDTEHPDDSLTTMEWYKVLGGRNPENTFLGTSYNMGGYVNYAWTEKPPVTQYPGPWLGPKSGFGGYAVHNSQHWVYKNTGLNDGDILGLRGDSSIVGYEADGAAYKFVNGIPVATGQDKTPLNFRILGLSPVSIPDPALGYDYPAPERNCTMGIYKREKPGGGFVFNAATVRWVWGLYSDTSAVSKVTKNILDHFLANKFPPEFVSWWPFTVKNQKTLALPMSFNRRYKEIPFGKGFTMRAEAKGYYDEKINYAWAVNDSIIPDAKGNLFFFHSEKYDLGSNKVTVYAFNSSDTVSINWEINSTENPLAITSIPDTVIHVGQLYRYALTHYSKSNSKVAYTPDYLPKWAKFDSEKNLIEGIPDCTRDSICVTLKDESGNKDTQSFVVKNLETTYVKTEVLPVNEFMLFQNYPNPFNGSTKIRFRIKNQSITELTISNLLGRKVRSFALGDMPVGYHEVTWDGNDDLGKPVSSGIYFYQVSFSSENSGILNLSKKLIYMK